MTVAEESAPNVADTSAAAESVVAKPTRPDASTTAEAVPQLSPTDPVEPASVEAPVVPEATEQLKLDLQEELAALKTELSSDMKTELSGLKTELKADRNELKAELKSDLSAMQTELQGDLSKLKAELEAELAELKTEVKAQPVVAAQPPAPPAEDNIFVEEKGKSSYEAFQDDKQDAKPATKESAKEDMPATPEPAAETEPSPPAAVEADSAFPLPEIPVPTLDEPAVPAPATPAPAEENSDGDAKPASDDDPFSSLSPEPVRRWFDDSGSHDTVGQLVEVHPDRVRIRKLNGRFTTVSISRLSTADQNYVNATAVRLAAQPRLTDTAGM